MTLMTLPEETWGEKVRRARERAGLTLKQAEELVGAVMPTTYRSIARLEEETDVPGRRRQQLAYVAVLAYGFDPAGFGLADTPVAHVIDKDAVLELIEAVRNRAQGLLTCTKRQVPQVSPRFLIAA